MIVNVIILGIPQIQLMATSDPMRMRFQTGCRMFHQVVISYIISKYRNDAKDIKRLSEVAKKTENQNQDKNYINNRKYVRVPSCEKGSDLLEYEKALHIDLKVERSKKLCLYHKPDLDSMFTADQTDKLIAYKVLFIS